jgi:hypothetical protein
LARRSEIEGMKELEKMIKKLGQLPQKVVTKAARKGTQIAQKSAKSDAPEEIGNLKKGIVLKGERSKIKGKKVYQVTFDRAMNTFFVKMSKDGKKRYYYPASQEYGFMTRDGGYVPGFRYLKKSIENNENKIEREIVDVLSKEIDKLK